MVQVPRLKELQPATQLPKSDRFNFNVQDQASNILGQSQKVASLAATAIDVHRRYEDETIDDESNEASVEYNNWIKPELKVAELKVAEGANPTDIYAAFDESEEAKFQEIMGRRPNLNSRVKENVSKNLNNIRSSHNTQVLSQRALQQEIYKNKTSEAALKVEKDNLPINASYIQDEEAPIVDGKRSVSSEAGYAPFEKGIDNMTTIIAKNGLRLGTVKKYPEDTDSFNHTYIGADGEEIKVQLSKIATARVNKEVGEGVANSIDAMVGAGNTGRAKTMMSKYGDSLPPKIRTTLNKKIADKELTKDSYKIAADIGTKPKEQQEAAIRRIKNPEQKSKVIAIMNDDQRRISDMRERREDSNYELLMKTLAAGEKSGAIKGQSDLENTEVYGKTFDNISAKQQQTVEEHFKAPKTSDQEVMAEAYDLLMGEEVVQMSASQYLEKLAGLSRVDKNTMMSKFYSRKTAKDSDSSTKTYKKAERITRTIMDSNEMLEYDKYRGKLEPESRVLWNKVRERLTYWLEDTPGKITEKETADTVNEMLEQLKKEELFGNVPGDASPALLKPLKKNYIAPVVPKSTGRRNNPLKGLDKRQLQRLRSSYIRKNGIDILAPFDFNDEEFIKYVNEVRK